MADDLDAIEVGIMNVYAENLRDGVDIETIRQMVQDETWLNGEEAAKYFNVQVSEENKMAACISDHFKDYKHVPKNLVSPAHKAENINEKLKIQNELDLLEL
jgi:hypothetical protein